jgi:hypothetical protein
VLQTERDREREREREREKGRGEFFVAMSFDVIKMRNYNGY